MEERNKPSKASRAEADDSVAQAEHPRVSEIAGRPWTELAERELVLKQFNDTAADYPRDRSIDELFESQVERSPDEIAAIWGGQQVTYAQLNCRANQVAHALLEVGVQPDDRIGLYTERSLATVVGMIAILKAGAAYVPLDPSYPAERLEFMRADSSMVAVLTTSALMSELQSGNLPVILVDGALSQSIENPTNRSHTSRSLAYIIYTSGSTGRPKGVMVEHRNVVALVINESYSPIGREDCVAHCSSPSFDATTWEVWAPLLNGARLLIVPQSVVFDPETLNRVVVQHGVTAMFLTVGLFNEYVDTLEEAFGRLRYLLTGGDALVPSIMALALNKSRRPQHLVNVYGPTETTTFATAYEIKSVPESATSIPIGAPIANVQLYILNGEREPVPIGATGEIYIAGAGVSRGYLNQKTLTDERFLADPFGEMSGALYRTGDLGRWRTDGNIEFLGRNDFQVKVRGFRIELGEVEAALLSFPGVRLAVAVAREEEPGVKRLLGYIVPELALLDESQSADNRVPGEEAISQLAQRLREYLQGKLPPHMVPAVIVPLKSLPLTPNGKLDRAALPAPDGREQLSHEYVAPSTPMEQALSAIWKQALKVERVGVQDNFFELGGDSLLGIETMGSIADTLNIDLHFMALFQYPTVCQLARFVDDQLAEDGNRAPPNVAAV